MPNRRKRTASVNTNTSFSSVGRTKRKNNQLAFDQANRDPRDGRRRSVKRSSDT